MKDTFESNLASARTAEEKAQKEYDDLMGDSRTARSQNSKGIVDKSATKAGLEGKLEETKAKQMLTLDEMNNVHKYLSEVHSDCDFLLNNFELRRAARANEIESLKNAKAVLAGANI
jgi:hypothetical protein